MELAPDLREGKPLVGGVLWAVEDLDEAIAKKQLKEDIIVYRGIDVLEIRQQFESAEVGATFTDGAFSSTTINPEVAHNFAMFAKDTSKATIIHAKLPAGHKALYISDKGDPASEYEVLLPRGTKLVITAKETDANGILHVYGEYIP